MICPLLKYTDMQTAMAELPEVFQLQIVWLGDAVTEVRWSGGVAVAQTDQPEALHGSHIGHGWIYVQVLHARPPSRPSSGRSLCCRNRPRC